MELDQLKKYPYVIRLVENEGLYFYAISFPDFPDVEAAGETPEEALSMGLDALEAMVDYLEEKGEPIPAPTVSPITENVSGRITLRMPKSLHRKLIEKSNEEGVSLNTCVITALAEYLANKKTKKNALLHLLLQERFGVDPANAKSSDVDSFESLDIDLTGPSTGNGQVKARA